MTKYLQTLILLPFAAAILWLHSAKGVSFDFFIYGSGSWGIGCILKIVLYQAVVRRIQHTDKNILRVSWGSQRVLPFLFHPRGRLSGGVSTLLADSRLLMGP